MQIKDISRLPENFFGREVEIEGGCTFLLPHFLWVHEPEAVSATNQIIVGPDEPEAIKMILPWFTGGSPTHPLLADFTLRAAGTVLPSHRPDVAASLCRLRWAESFHPPMSEVRPGANLPYSTRYNFGAVHPELAHAMPITKAARALAVAGQSFPISEPITVSGTLIARAPNSGNHSVLCGGIDEENGHSGEVRVDAPLLYERLGHLSVTRTEGRLRENAKGNPKDRYFTAVLRGRLTCDGDQPLSIQVAIANVTNYLTTVSGFARYWCFRW